MSLKSKVVLVFVLIAIAILIGIAVPLFMGDVEHNCRNPGDTPPRLLERLICSIIVPDYNTDR